MKTLALNITVAVLALLFGLAWVAAYQFFLVGEITPTASQQVEKVEFDISDPDSVLPIDYEEEKLSDPKEDESNPEYFDPEGRFHLLEESKMFEDFSLLTIQNKNLEVDSDDERFGELIPPEGTLLLADKDEGADGCDMHDYFDIPKIRIENGRMNFETKKRNGIIYEFKGEFIVKGNFYTLDFYARVLQGTLTKKKNGKIVAKEMLKFGWSNSDICLH